MWFLLFLQLHFFRNFPPNHNPKNFKSDQTNTSYNSVSEFFSGMPSFSENTFLAPNGDSLNKNCSLKVVAGEAIISSMSLVSPGYLIDRFVPKGSHIREKKKKYCLSVNPLVRFTVPPLDSETGRTGDFWLKTVFQK